MGSGKSLYELMNEVSIVDFAAALLLISVIVILLASQKDKLHEMFESWRKKTNFNENVMNLVNQLNDEHQTFRKTMSTFAENRSSDREVSKQIRDNLYANIDKMNEQMLELKTEIQTLQERNKKTTRASIKDRIRNIYNQCSATQTITEMEWDTLNDLISDYEENDGLNSFIHSKVAIEMYKWKRVPDDYYRNMGDDK